MVERLPWMRQEEAGLPPLEEAAPLARRHVRQARDAHLLRRTPPAAALCCIHARCASQCYNQREWAGLSLRGGQASLSKWQDVPSQYKDGCVVGDVRLPVAITAQAQRLDCHDAVPHT